MKEPILSREQFETAEREYGYDRDTDIARRGFADGWEAAVALLEKLCGEPIYQIGDGNELWRDAEKDEFDSAHHARIVYALNRSKA
ncbi:hypothetical protein [Burkholderia cenocepacia]|uniref:hypothetical protein n=1 Tax=Burkholderia cenocepacia TaxID=95486 RepID=UPI002B24A6C2|nr:hypothetical protein [Burkholderia cenocepacia]MEB2544319.1 hypothetical protein [Burkholderia cenocepacia]